MKKILISTLFLLPLCACVDTERPLIEKNQSKIINIEKKEPKKDIVHPIIRKKLGIIEEEKVPEYVENIAKTTIVPISDFDQVAMTMTGQYVPEEFENDRIYYGYMKFFDREWARLQRNSIGHIPEWATANITSKAKTTDTVFYPFGGPDIAYALSFFPSAREYILVGLEPIGNFNDVKSAVSNSKSFEQIKRSLFTYLRGGYFITSEMGETLSNKFLRGTLYLILLELSAFDFEIKNVEDLSIDSLGEEIIRGHNMLDCIKITCRKRGESDWRYVYYIRADLSDSNKAIENLFNFMKKRTFHTFLKSASYAIWDRTLTGIRQFVLDNSQFILQDDTGVPFSSFDKKWNRYAFGSYTEPTLSYFRKGYKQPHMAKFFEKNQQASIPFKIGYGFYQARPNLLLAVPQNKTNAEKDAEIIREVEHLKEKYENADKCENCGDDEGNSKEAQSEQTEAAVE